MRSYLCLAFAGVFLLISGSRIEAAKAVPLEDDWSLQSACKLKDSGSAISSPGFRPQNWIAATVPTTVLAAEVAASGAEGIVLPFESVTL
jgi:hypothetical protein